MKLRTLLTKLLQPINIKGRLTAPRLADAFCLKRLGVSATLAALTLSGCSVMDNGMQPGSPRHESLEKEPTLEDLDQTSELNEVKKDKLLAVLKEELAENEIKDDKSLAVLHPDKASVKVDPQEKDQEALVIFDSKVELVESEDQQTLMNKEQAKIYNASQNYIDMTLSLSKDFQESVKMGQEKGQKFIDKSTRKLEEMIDGYESMDDFDAEKIKEGILALMSVDTDNVLNAYVDHANKEVKRSEAFLKTIDNLTQGAEKVYETWEKGHDKLLSQYDKKLALEEKRFDKALVAYEKKQDKEIALAEKKHSKECDKLDKELERNCKKWDAAFERFCKKEKNALLIEAQKNILEHQKQEEQNRIEQEKQKSQQLLLQHKNNVEAERVQKINEEEERSTANKNRIELEKSKELLDQQIKKNIAEMDIEIKKAELLEKQDAKVKEEFDKQMKLYEQEVAIGYEFIKNQMAKNRSYRFTNDPPKIVEEGGKRVVKPGVVKWSAY